MLQRRAEAPPDWRARASDQIAERAAALPQVIAARRVALIDAVKSGDVATVRTLIAQKADVDAAEADGTTALHWAAHLGDAVSTDLLIKAGANVKAATRNGATPFGLACYKGNAAVIERLLVAGEDPNAVVTGEPRAEIGSLMTGAQATGATATGAQEAL